MSDDVRRGYIEEFDDGTVRWIDDPMGEVFIEWEDYTSLRSRVDELEARQQDLIDDCFDECGNCGLIIVAGSTCWRCECRAVEQELSVANERIRQLEMEVPR